MTLDFESFSVFVALIGFSFLSLGSDESVDYESDPLQQASDLQQGKQLFHLTILIPLLLKSNILFTNCMYACFCVKY